MLERFHLAIAVDDLEAARAFYVGVLDARVGRESERWIDFDLRGHQVSAHLAETGRADAPENDVDGQAVPVRHFGLILDAAAFAKREAKLRAAQVPFLIEPHTRFAGTPGEQRTMFISDPAGNGIEFKTFADDAFVFAAFDD